MSPASEAGSSRKKLLALLSAAQRRLEGDDSDPSLPGPSRLDPRTDWKTLAAAAKEIRIAGAAFTLFLQGDLTGLDLSEKTLGQLRGKLEKALESELGDDYKLEDLATRGHGLEVAISANTFYSRSRSLLFSTRSPWPTKVDAAAEAMRRAALEMLRNKDNRRLNLVASWTPGEKVFAEVVTLTDDAPVAAVQETLRGLGDLKTRLEAARFGIAAIAVALALLGIVLALTLHDVLFPSYILVYALLALVFLPLVNGRLATTRNEIAELKERLELRGLLDEEERRAFRLFQLHNLDLKRYYDLALTQRRFIFGLGVFCVLLGSAVAVTALILLSDDSTSNQQKIFISGVGALGTILINFVAVIYLRMFRDTVSSMNTFHNRLVATHHLLFGNLLAARIGNRTKRDATLADMASSIAHIDSPAHGAQGKGEASRLEGSPEPSKS